MPVGELITRLFNIQTDESRPRDLALAAVITAISGKDKAERDKAQRLIDWYTRDREEILIHLKEAAKKTFGDATATWHFPTKNDVPKIVRRLSLTYKDPPVRQYLRGGVELASDSDEMKAIGRMYRLVDVNRKFKELDRWATLLNTVHMEVVPRRGAIDWDIKLRPITTVVPDPEDYLEFSKIAFRLELLNPETFYTSKGWIYWTKNEHFFLSDGGELFGLSAEDGSNPYEHEGEKIIPIVTARKLELNDYWGAFGSDIVESVEAMNVQLANLHENIFLQTHGIPVIINFGMKTGSKIVFGPMNPLVAEDVDKSLVPPSLEFKSPNPDIEETRKYLDWSIKGTGSSYGMPASAFADEEKDLSGFAKKIDNLELLEERQEEVPKWIRTEEDAFLFSRLVWNRFKAADEPEVPMDIELRVVFREVAFPENPAEKSSRELLDVKMNKTSVVRILMEEKGLSEEDALKEAKQNAAWTAAISTSAGAGRPELPSTEGLEE